MFGRTSVSLQDYVNRVADDLRAYHDTGTRALQDEIDRRMLTVTEAMNTTAEAIDGRLERMNEFREAMKDQASRMVDADLFKALADRVDNVERNLDRQRGRMTVYAGLSGLLIAVVTIVTLVVNHIRL